MLVTQDVCNFNISKILYTTKTRRKYIDRYIVLNKKIKKSKQLRLLHIIMRLFIFTFAW